jgi:hypothetical protein
LILDVRSRTVPSRHAGSRERPLPSAFLVGGGPASRTGLRRDGRRWPRLGSRKQRAVFARWPLPDYSPWRWTGWLTSSGTRSRPRTRRCRCSRTCPPCRRSPRAGVASIRRDSDRRLRRQRESGQRPLVRLAVTHRSRRLWTSGSGRRALCGVRTPRSCEPGAGAGGTACPRWSPSLCDSVFKPGPQARASSRRRRRHARPRFEEGEELLGVSFRLSSRKAQPSQPIAPVFQSLCCYPRRRGCQSAWLCPQICPGGIPARLACLGGGRQRRRGRPPRRSRPRPPPRPRRPT